jgi:hypothetical protein
MVLDHNCSRLSNTFHLCYLFIFNFEHKNVFFLFNCLVKKKIFFHLEIEIVDAVVGNVEILVVAVDRDI